MQCFNRDVSWLGFNYRVLQEAAKETVPLYERILFLSIFSSNLDEFFRVRYSVYASLDKVVESSEPNTNITLEIADIVKKHLPEFGVILTQSILPELFWKGVHLYYNEDLSERHIEFVRNYFFTQVLAFLQPTILSEKDVKIELDNNTLYFLVTLKHNDNIKYALVNIPHEHLPRFITLPPINNIYQIIFLDDIIRYNLHAVFPDFELQECHSIKLTRSADVDIVDEWSDLFEEEVVKMIKKREKGAPTRLLYEYGMNGDTKVFLSKYFGIQNSSIISGGRYHNLKDLAGLPNPLGGVQLKYPKHIPNDNPISKHNTIFDALDEADQMLHLPYHSYNNVLRFFNEAAIHPSVKEISITLYRVASDSYITNALISAAKNGKIVTAFVELKARFDEENNLLWAKKMKAAGVNIIYSIPDMKVHAKIAIVKYKNGLQAKYYSLLSTGNFNEKTARFYTDHILFTANKKITKDVDMLFTYLKARQQPKNYQYIDFNSLLVTGFNFLERFQQLVQREIEYKKNGKGGSIIIKINNLEEESIIKLLYKASSEGVKVELVVRGICCLVPNVKGLSENITVKRIVGRYLEHSRIFIFNNDGDKEVFLGSADMMNRNIHRRIEAIYPVYDAKLKAEILYVTNLHLTDNVQATMLDNEGRMLHEQNNKTEPVDAQQRIYEYINTI